MISASRVILFGALGVLGIYLVVLLVLAVPKVVDSREGEGGKDKLSSRESRGDGVGFYDSAGAGAGWTENLLMDAPLQVVGTVVDTLDAAIPDAEIQLRLSPAHSWTTLRADDKGEFKVQLEPWASMSPLARSTAHLFCKAEAPLHWYSWTETPISLEAGDMPILLFPIRLKPGPCLVGRILHSDGSAPTRMEEAEIYFRMKDWKKVTAHTAQDNGRYRIPIKEPGEYRIAVAHPSFGHSDTHVINLDGKADSAGPDLVLREEGVIQGVAVYPDGKPVVKMDISAYTLTYEGDLPRELLFNEDPAKRPGLPGGRTFTDGEGRFTFKGLRPAQYYITYSDSHLADAGNMTTHGVDSFDVRAVIDLYLIRVRVLDVRGQPVPGAAIVMSVKVEDRFMARNPVVVWHHEGVQIFEAYPDVTLRFTASAHNVSSVEKTVEVVEGQYENLVELRLE